MLENSFARYYEELKLQNIGNSFHLPGSFGSSMIAAQMTAEIM